MFLSPPVVFLMSKQKRWEKIGTEGGKFERKHPECKKNPLELETNIYVLCSFFVVFFFQISMCFGFYIGYWHSEGLNNQLNGNISNQTIKMYI